MVEIVLISSVCPLIKPTTAVECVLFRDDNFVNDEDDEANFTDFPSSTVLAPAILIRDGLRDTFGSSTFVTFIKSLTNSSESFENEFNENFRSSYLRKLILYLSESE